MAAESSKACHRRLYSPGFINRYFVGHGIDIGAGTDGLSHFSSQFPLMESCRDWDIEDGDAQYLEGVGDNLYDFVHSAHCLEHMFDPWVAISNWYRVLKPGGHLVVLVPDEDLYEHGEWPSKYNPDHKASFTIYKEQPSSHTVCIMELLQSIPCQILKIELLEHTYDYAGPARDQTRELAECAIEFVVRKL